MMEVQLKELQKKNDEYLSVFNDWLSAKGLVNKTIRNHMNNIDLLLNDYMPRYYDDCNIHEALLHIDDFIGYFFIHKCMWSSVSTVKSTAASVKKFYECMFEKNFISKEELEDVKWSIKEDMSE